MTDRSPAPARPCILQVIPRLDTGGAEQTTIDMVEAIVKAGGRALVATEGGRLEPRIGELGGEVVHLPVGSKSPATILINARRLSGLAQREGVNLIHVRSRAPAWSCLIAARRLKLPLVTTYHGAYAGTSPVKTWYNGVMARGDVVIANSRFTAQLIEQRHRTPADRLVVVHRGVDLRRFDPAVVSAERGAALRRAWGVASGRPVILNAARLTGWKGQMVVVEAAIELFRAGRLGDAVVVLVGDAQGRDGYVEQLRSRIASAGLTDRVVLAGHCADMPAAFREACVSVVASTEPEAFGRVAAEAMAMGCPVIATDIGAPPEILAAGSEKVGWLVRPNDPHTLAEAIAAVLAMPLDECRSLAQRARRQVAQHFSLLAMQRATLAVYDRLLGTRLADRLIPPNGAPEAMSLARD